MKDAFWGTESRIRDTLAHFEYLQSRYDEDLSTALSGTGPYTTEKYPREWRGYMAEELLEEIRLTRRRKSQPRQRRVMTKVRSVKRQWWCSRCEASRGPHRRSVDPETGKVVCSFCGNGLMGVQQ